MEVFFSMMLLLREGSGEAVGSTAGWAVIAMLTLLLPSCGGEGPAEPIETPGDLTLTFESGGWDRTYDLHVPSTIDLSRPSPLVILLHGVPRGSGMRVLTGFDDVADRFGFVVAYPRSFGADWNVGCGDLCTSAGRDGIDDIAFLRALVDEVGSALTIDRSRVYMAGFSQGALMTHHAACELSDRIAAFASVGASMLDVVAAGCGPSPLSILFIHGTVDPQFPWGGHTTELTTSLAVREMVERWMAIDGCSSEPNVTEFPDTEDDGTTVTLEEYRGCSGGVGIDFYIVEGGGHTWPGAPVEFSAALGPKSLEINASEILAEFFSRN
jgi:polyhydroxybutyrate depolymerase